MPMIEEKYGQEGKRALLYLDKIKLIESQWITGQNGPEKAYHTYYTSVQINLLGNLSDLADIIYATTMPEEELAKFEKKVESMIGNSDGVFIGDAAEALSMSQTLIRGLVRRSSVLQIKGYKITTINGA